MLDRYARSRFCQAKSRWKLISATFAQVKTTISSPCRENLVSSPTSLHIHSTYSHNLSLLASSRDRGSDGCASSRLVINGWKETLSIFLPEIMHLAIRPFFSFSGRREE